MEIFHGGSDLVSFYRRITTLRLTTTSEVIASILSTVNYHYLLTILKDTAKEQVYCATYYNLIEIDQTIRRPEHIMIMAANLINTGFCFIECHGAFYIHFGPGSYVYSPHKSYMYFLWISYIFYKLHTVSYYLQLHISITKVILALHCIVKLIYI
jgi:hypothetical protein